MKIPRDITALDLIRALRLLDYETVRQDGSYIRLTTTMEGTHHVTIQGYLILVQSALVRNDCLI